MTKNYATQPPLTYVKPNFLTTVSSTPLQLTGAGTQLIVSDNASIGSLNVIGTSIVGALTVTGLTTVTTAPANDSSTTVASTAFVNRAITNAAATVAITGGSIINASLTNMIAGMTVFTGAGNLTLLPSQYVVLINKASPAQTTVTLPLNATVGQVYKIKDRAGNADTYPITVQPASGLIDGAANLVISNKYASVELVWDGIAWSIL